MGKRFSRLALQNASFYTCEVLFNPDMNYHQHMANSSTRLYYIDWLRIIAVLMLIPYHAALHYYAGNAWLNNDESALGFLFVHFVHQWQLPLLFLASGTATWFSLRKRSAGQYTLERAQRLLIPLLLVLVNRPAEVYLLARRTGETQASFFGFYPDAINMLLSQSFSVAVGVLWFLVYLFLFSIILLPLMLYLRSEVGQGFIDKLADITQKRFLIFLFAVPIMLIEVTLRAQYGHSLNLIGDWANVLMYGYVFLMGYVLASDARFLNAARRDGHIALGLAVLTFIGALVWIVMGGPLEWVAHNQLTAGWYLYAANRGLGIWLWMVGWLWLGQKVLNQQSTLLTYLSGAAMPMYLIHATLLVLIGFYLTPLNLNSLLQFVLLIVLTFGASIGVYEIIKRTNPTRVLFGLRPEKTSVRHHVG